MTPKCTKSDFRWCCTGLNCRPSSMCSLSVLRTKPPWSSNRWGQQCENVHSGVVKLRLYSVIFILLSMRCLYIMSISLQIPFFRHERLTRGQSGWSGPCWCVLGKRLLLMPSNWFSTVRVTPRVSWSRFHLWTVCWYVLADTIDKATY